jgi:hypothetical protein
MVICKTLQNHSGMEPLDFSDLAKHLLLIHHFGTHDMLVLCRDHSTGINVDQRGTLDLATQKLALGISGYSCH